MLQTNFESSWELSKGKKGKSEISLFNAFSAWGEGEILGGRREILKLLLAVSQLIIICNTACYFFVMSVYCTGGLCVFADLWFRNFQSNLLSAESSPRRHSLNHIGQESSFTIIFHPSQRQHLNFFLSASFSEVNLYKREKETITISHFQFYCFFYSLSVILWHFDAVAAILVGERGLWLMATTSISCAAEEHSVDTCLICVKFPQQANGPPGSQRPFGRELSQAISLQLNIWHQMFLQVWLYCFSILF